MLEKNKPPILGLIQRSGQVVLRKLANVQQATIKPIITAAVTLGTLIYTDEYSIYARLPAWGFQYKTVLLRPSVGAPSRQSPAWHLHRRTCQMVQTNTPESNISRWFRLGFWLIGVARPHRGYRTARKKHSDIWRQGPAR